ncbi:hypothetical protein [Paenibacillus cymbidii]|uniref:hypothetical protein n=1 Tax=Paenibacillus cymbidii TaxID=1639034 RepID=UPI0014369855|nr:hypothetical protein [Paenibacillus cymbidii]
MTLPFHKIRIIANACLIRYDAGEGEIADIVASYQLAETDRTKVVAEIRTRRTELEKLV